MAAWKKTHALHLQNAALACVPFSPNAKALAFGSINNTMYLCDVANGREVQPLSQKAVQRRIEYFSSHCFLTA